MVLRAKAERAEMIRDDLVEVIKVTKRILEARLFSLYEKRKGEEERRKRKEKLMVKSSGRISKKLNSKTRQEETCLGGTVVSGEETTEIIIGVSKNWSFDSESERETDKKEVSKRKWNEKRRMSGQKRLVRWKQRREHSDKRVEGPSEKEEDAKQRSRISVGSFRRRVLKEVRECSRDRI